MENICSSTNYFDQRPFDCVWRQVNINGPRIPGRRIPIRTHLHHYQHGLSSPFRAQRRSRRTLFACPSSRSITSSSSLEDDLDPPLAFPQF
ncbi:hypothetical protein GALMADRAFT_251695 [Galerina marginata CBS 339.88]|uniref:Uncharacterized protein n=1 Tax=Galerina marginata (strain CBS 339.88) TaxID=685588 RepID=A0A067SQG2_GALM3|nr:hypothetical protein GALMADRAFT_251695 [Galerina marginata CBS 339.88]